MKAYIELLRHVRFPNKRHFTATFWCLSYYERQQAAKALLDYAACMGFADPIHRLKREVAQ